MRPCHRSSSSSWDSAQETRSPRLLVAVLGFSSRLRSSRPLHSSSSRRLDRNLANRTFRQLACPSQSAKSSERNGSFVLLLHGGHHTGKAGRWQGAARLSEPCRPIRVRRVVALRRAPTFRRREERLRQRDSRSIRSSHPCAGRCDRSEPADARGRRRAGASSVPCRTET